MNSLNIISARVSPTSSPAPSRSNSLSHIGLAVAQSGDNPTSSEGTLIGEKGVTASESNESPFDKDDEIPGLDEKTPLLEKDDCKESNIRSYSWHAIPGRITNNIVNSIRWVLSTIAAPGVYLVACFYDEQGNFAPLRQLRSLLGIYGGDTRKFAADYHETIALGDEKLTLKRPSQSIRGKHAFTASRPALSSGTSSSGISSESDSDTGSRTHGTRRGSGSSGHHARSKSLDASEESVPARRSIRIKLNNDEAMRQRKHKKAQSMSASGGANSGEASSDLSAQLKSPTSPVSALTRYPKTPAPPRPLIPRRQPSFLPYEPVADPKHLKTLILDLDETLIHSMSKGGRMGSGHMVEVRLNTTYVASGGQQALGPQHPILYYVHKRPHCDEFLRKVCKWFNLVVFTASVQEYADPVIDWLESERKYFSGRYYRQHCTFRHGAFIKDLSSIEPDLSKVMILDNSPLSYMFHQDNAIPIQGWINDPTDNDLLHLVPLLEGLQYVSDVRALLALRGGEDGQHMTT
ncbi:hypothetical protein M426DRAFT_70895 [Hypoxylon sp. CI-4A]|nr:hypothetical protein M426DRAFT_70895 [Hypoxylon sp. CI-4A]